MKDQKVIRSPEAFQLLADETRLRIVYLLRAREMAVSQIAGELRLTPQTVYHHIKKLRKAEMVEVSREEQIGHITQSYFRATAGLFYFVHGCLPDTKESPERTRRALDELATLGIRIEADHKKLAKIARLRGELRGQKELCELADKIIEKDGLDPFVQEDMTEFALMTRMDDREFEKHIDTLRELRKLLLHKSESGR